MIRAIPRRDLGWVGFIMVSFSCIYFVIFLGLQVRRPTVTVSLYLHCVFIFGIRLAVLELEHIFSAMTLPIRLCLPKFAVLAVHLAFVPPLVAEDSIASAVALGDRTPDPDQALTAEGAERAHALALYYKGNELTADGKIDEAVSTFREVIAIDPTNIELAARTAAMLAQLGKDDEAVVVVEGAKTANPNDVAGAVALVDFLRSFRRGDEPAQARMMEVAREAVEKFPKEPRAYKILVRAHVEKGDWEAASAALETALSQEDVDPEFWVLIGRLGQEIWPYRGERAAEENLERLVGIYYRALKNGADTPRDVQHSVARFFRSTGQLDDARGLYQGMAIAVPEDLGTRALYARTLLAMGRAEEGIAELEKLAEIDPNDLETHEILAEAYRNMEDYAEAARHTTAAIRLGSNSLSDYLAGANLYNRAGDLRRSHRTPRARQNHLSRRADFLPHPSRDLQLKVRLGERHRGIRRDRKNHAGAPQPRAALVVERRWI